MDVTGVAPLDLITQADVEAAAARLKGRVLLTPLVPLRRGAGRWLLKAECLQPIGAFKIRGATNALLQLDDDARRRGVIAASSGNHAQGIARAARLLGIDATVAMPVDASPVKRGRVLEDGATIVDWDPYGEVPLDDLARSIAAERGLTFIHPFDDPRVIAGQGTVGLEIAQAVEDLAAVLVPIGGGGLISGVATAIRALRPGARIIGVEPELAADARDSFRARALVEWPTALGRRTIADGTRVNLSPRTLAHLLALVDDVIAIPETEIGPAVRIVAEETRLVAEPSGALTTAALAFHEPELGLSSGGSVVAIVSGGNIAMAQMGAMLGSRQPDGVSPIDAADPPA